MNKKILLDRYCELGEKFELKHIDLKKNIRINTLKISEVELIKRLTRKGVSLQKIPFLDHGYSYIAKFSLASTQEYLEGLFYIQETASQIPVQELDPKPKEFVLDMAASPGSKTTQIAQNMNDEGVLVAIDIDAQRINKLKNNLERLSVTNTVLIQMDARKADKLNKKFDKILLDAPCSGNYCIEKDFFKKRKVKDFKNKSWLQRELLATAYNCLKKGGTLIYSTCSLEPEEDEITINWFINEYKDMKLQPLKIELGDFGLTKIFNKKLNQEIKKTKKFWPHKTGTQGFYIAKLVKQ